MCDFACLKHFRVFFEFPWACYLKSADWEDCSWCKLAGQFLRYPSYMRATVLRIRGDIIQIKTVVLPGLLDCPRDRHSTFLFQSDHFHPCRKYFALILCEAHQFKSLHAWSQWARARMTCHPTSYHTWAATSLRHHWVVPSYANFSTANHGNLHYFRAHLCSSITCDASHHLSAVSSLSTSWHNASYTSIGHHIWPRLGSQQSRGAKMKILSSQFEAKPKCNNFTMFSTSNWATFHHGIVLWYLVEVLHRAWGSLWRDQT